MRRLGVLFVAVLAFISLASLAWGAGYGPMPSIKEYPVVDSGFQGHLPCGNAYLEVRSTKRPDEWVVVWLLEKKVLAVVFVYPGYYQAFVDYDFDGKWNYVEIEKAGGGTADAFYRKVKGCESWNP